MNNPAASGIKPADACSFFSTPMISGATMTLTAQRESNSSASRKSRVTARSRCSKICMEIYGTWCNPGDFEKVSPRKHGDHKVLLCRLAPLCSRHERCEQKESLCPLCLCSEHPLKFLLDTTSPCTYNLGRFPR